MFLSPESQVLGSPGEAVSFILHHSPPYTQEDVRRIEYVTSQLRGDTQEDVRMMENVSDNLVGGDNRQEEAQTKSKHDYEEDSSVPRLGTLNQAFCSTKKYIFSSRLPGVGG